MTSVAGRRDVLADRIQQRRDRGQRLTWPLIESMALDLGCPSDLPTLAAAVELAASLASRERRLSSIRPLIQPRPTAPERVTAQITYGTCVHGGLVGPIRRMVLEPISPPTNRCLLSAGGGTAFAPARHP